MTDVRSGYNPDPDELKGVDPALYAAVAQRRISFDNLVWQVPVVSLTAQAFLFTIALFPGNGQFARAVSSVLAFVAAMLSIQTMARHRQSELTDAHWLRAYEEANFGHEFHGIPWRDAREQVDVGFDVSNAKGYRAWTGGFGLFALAALATFVLTFAAPDLLK